MNTTRVSSCPATKMVDRRCARAGYTTRVSLDDVGATLSATGYRVASDATDYLLVHPGEARELARAWPIIARMHPNAGASVELDYGECRVEGVVVRIDIGAMGGDAYIAVSDAVIGALAAADVHVSVIVDVG